MAPPAWTGAGTFERLGSQALRGIFFSHRDFQDVAAAQPHMSDYAGSDGAPRANQRRAHLRARRDRRLARLELNLAADGSSSSHDDPDPRSTYAKEDPPLPPYRRGATVRAPQRSGGIELRRSKALDGAGRRPGLRSALRRSSSQCVELPRRNLRGLSAGRWERLSRDVLADYGNRVRRRASVDRMLGCPVPLCLCGDALHRVHARVRTWHVQLPRGRLCARRRPLPHLDRCSGSDSGRRSSPSDECAQELGRLAPLSQDQRSAPPRVELRESEPHTRGCSFPLSQKTEGFQHDYGLFLVWIIARFADRV